MHNAIQLMLKRYSCHSLHDYEQALREILQEIALVGLWRGKFFEHTAFYGGTALRIFYGLDRFSEDLDFTLLKPKANWSWLPYGTALKNELASYGFEVSFTEKEKKSQTAIKSAFLKTSTVQELLKIGVHADILKHIHPETIIRIKIEVDTHPPIDFSWEQKFLSEPIPVSIRCVSQESLFAAKMHAAFYRSWKGRVKGRDWYDIIWFIRKKIPLNLTLFSKFEGLEVPLSRQRFLEIAYARIEQLNISIAMEDIFHFVKDQEIIQRSWTKEYFKDWMNQLVTYP